MLNIFHVNSDLITPFLFKYLANSGMVENNLFVTKHNVETYNTSLHQWEARNYQIIIRTS